MYFLFNESYSIDTPEVKCIVCEAKACNKPPLSGFKLCADHKCKVKGCRKIREKFSLYCCSHKCARSNCNNFRITDMDIV